MVSQRDGKLFIIDGQHRWEGAKARGDIAFLPCAVGSYASAREEAALFVAANRRRVAVNRMDLFRSALAAGEATAVTIDRLAREAGLVVGGSVKSQDLKAGEINCTGALYRALEQRGEEGLGLALRILGAAFAGQVLDYATPLLDAVLDLSRRVGEEALVKALASREAAKWVRDPAIAGLPGANERKAAIRRIIMVVVEHDADPPEPDDVDGNAPPLPTFLKPAETDWCTQCDQRRSGAQAAKCRSAFCKLKVAA